MLTQIREGILDGSEGHAHFVRFYDDDSRLLDEVADFVDGALRAEGTGIVIATADHIAGLRRRLAGLGNQNGRAGWFSGQLITLDAEETLAQFMVDGWPDEIRFNNTVGKVVAEACAGKRVVSAFGEMVALLCAQGLYDAAIRLEELWNNLGRRYSFSLFCAYPWQLFPTVELTNAFRRVCAEHDHVCSSGHSPESGNQKDVQLRLAVLEQKALALEVEVARRTKSERTLKHREKELADFLENAAEGLHRVGPDGIILWANKAELKMLGYRWEEYVGRHIAEFHADRPVIESILAKLHAGETLYDQPARLRCKDGSIKHVVIHSNGCFEDEKLRYTRCFTRDATERHLLDQAHAEREALLAELSKANRTKDEFLAMLGHELRNPLSPIVMALELMRMRDSDVTRREQDIIKRHVDHLVRLVDDLLDISRITRGQIDLRIERIEMSQVFDKAIEMAGTLLEQRSHRFDIELEPGLSLEADPARLAQVVANLITNAARYTDAGGHISLSAGKYGPDGIRISVKDNGIGISQEMLPHIFDLFFQGHRKMDRAEGGLGIGLSLVKNIVELHGGTVMARSPGEGQGSEFIVQLPAKPGFVMPDQPAKVPAAGTAVVANKRRIMLVDDNADAADTLAGFLSLNGHAVEVFNDPVAALEAVGWFKPEIAVLDIGLPNLDGYELAARIRSLLGAQPCRLIALSGYGQEADKARSKAAGFERHFVKPIRPEDLARLTDTPFNSSEAPCDSFP